MFSYLPQKLQLTKIGLLRLDAFMFRNCLQLM